MRLVPFLLLIALSSPVMALHIRFQAYEGRDQIVDGQGGTKVTTDGVDYWTSGTPPHRFKVIGVILDTRVPGLVTKDAVGSKAIAAKVREVGGDALIVMNQEFQPAGVVGGYTANAYGNFASGVHHSRVVGKTATSFQVVKYLDEK